MIRKNLASVTAEGRSWEFASRFINLICERSKIKFANFISGEARGDVAKISRRTPLKFLSVRTRLKFFPQLRCEISPGA